MLRVTNSSALFGVVLVAATSACTSLLGTFDPGGSGGAAQTAVTTTSSSGGDGGGAGGEGGQGGGGVGGQGGQGGAMLNAPNYDCMFELGSPRVLHMVDQGLNERVRDIFVANRGAAGPPRVLVQFDLGGPLGTLVAIDAETPGTRFEAGGIIEVLQAGRLSATANGVLAVVDHGAGRMLVMFEVPDGKDAFAERVLLPPSMFPPIPASTQVSGGFVSLDPASSSWTADVVFTVQNSDGKHSARYGRFSLVGGDTVSFVAENSPLASDGMELSTIFWHAQGTKTYAYLRRNLEIDKTQEFALDGGVTGFIAPRTHGGGTMFASLARPTGINLMSVTFNLPNFELRVAQVPHERVGVFDESEFVLHQTFDIDTEMLPVGDPHIGWFGDILAFVGAQTKNSKGRRDDLAYYFIGADGQLRGAKKFPVALPPSEPGFVRDKVERVAAAARPGALEGAKTDVHVAWLDVESKDEFEYRYRVAFNVLACTPLP